MEQPPGRPAAGEVVHPEAVLLEDALGKIAAQPHRAARHVGLRPVEFGEARPQAPERDVDRAGNRPHLVFGRFAHVDDLRVRRERVRRDDVALAGKDVLRDEAEEVHRVLRRAVRRRVGKLEFAELRGLELHAHRLGDRVDPLVDAFRADDLRPVDRAVRAEEELHAEPRRTGIVTRPGRRMDVDLLVVAMLGLEPRLGPSDTCRGQLADLDDARPEGAPVDARAAGHVVRGDAALLVGRHNRRQRCSRRHRPNSAGTWSSR